MFMQYTGLGWRLLSDNTYGAVFWIWDLKSMDNTLVIYFCCKVFAQHLLYFSVLSQWAGRVWKSDGIWPSWDSKWPKAIFCVIQDCAPQEVERSYFQSSHFLETVWAPVCWCEVVGDWLCTTFLFLFFFLSSFIRWSLSEPMRLSCFALLILFPTPLAETEQANDCLPYKKLTPMKQNKDPLSLKRLRKKKKANRGTVENRNIYQLCLMLVAASKTFRISLL